MEVERCETELLQKMKEYIRLLRPLQWIKNIFVFAPIFFSTNLMKGEFWKPTLIVFVSFCLISSSIYCFNDIQDAEADRQHPQKNKRPIASRAVSMRSGYFLMFLCMMGAYTMLILIKSVNTPSLFAIITGYWLMNIAYCIKLKRYAIIDVLIIAIGFVLRVLIGGQATNIWISQWLVLMTFLLALFLALAKRSDDFSIFEHTGIKPRASITGYNKEFINGATAIIASVTLVCYIMYTMSPEVIERMGTCYIYLTIGWVLAGLLRYLQNMIVYNHSDSPTKSLVNDRFIQLCILGWLVSFFAIIYL